MFVQFNDMGDAAPVEDLAAALMKWWEGGEARRRIEEIDDAFDVCLDNSSKPEYGSQLAFEVRFEAGFNEVYRELLKKVGHDNVHPEDRAIYQRMLRAVEKGAPKHLGPADVVDALMKTMNHAAAVQLVDRHTNFGAWLAGDLALRLRRAPYHRRLVDVPREGGHVGVGVSWADVARELDLPVVDADIDLVLGAGHQDDRLHLIQVRGWDGSPQPEAIQPAIDALQRVEGGSAVASRWCVLVNGTLLDDVFEACTDLCNELGTVDSSENEHREFAPTYNLVALRVHPGSPNEDLDDLD